MKWIIVTGTVIVPISVIMFSMKYPDKQYKNIFILFIFILVAERIWETFYTSKERRGHKLYGDWTLPLVSIAYIALVLIVIYGFFIVPTQLNLMLTLLGVLMFISSLGIRLWGMRTLKDQWSIHAIGAKKVKKTVLIREGPYKYARHPIYLAVIIEVLSIPMIWNVNLAIIFAGIINIPLQLIRAYFEEKSSVRKFGEIYVKYRREVPAFLPFRVKTPMRHNDD